MGGQAGLHVVVQIQNDLHRQCMSSHYFLSYCSFFFKQYFSHFQGLHKLPLKITLNFLLPVRLNYTDV